MTGHTRNQGRVGPEASCLLEAAWPGLCPGPAPTLTPGSGPSVTLFLPVQDMLLGEGVEVPPFLPASALPPAQACSRGLGCCPGGAGMQPREQEPCDHGATSAAHAVPGEEGDGGRTRYIAQGWWTEREKGGWTGREGGEVPVRVSPGNVTIEWGNTEHS